MAGCWMAFLHFCAQRADLCPDAIRCRRPDRARSLFARAAGSSAAARCSDGGEFTMACTSIQSASVGDLWTSCIEQSSQLDVVVVFGFGGTCRPVYVLLE